MHKQPRHARRSLAGALLGVVLMACAADRPVTGELRGRALPEPVARPSFTLPSLDGTPYDFAERTAGKLHAKPAFRGLPVRPPHPQGDPAAQAVFRRGSPVS